MRMKSYFSSTVESAVELARRELGPEAMLVNSRPAMPEARHLGEYEVVFAADFPPAQGEAAPQQPPPATPRKPNEQPLSIGQILQQMMERAKGKGMAMPAMPQKLSRLYPALRKPLPWSFRLQEAHPTYPSLG